MKKISEKDLEYLTDREREEREYTKEELFQMVSNKDRILTLVEVSKILDTCWPLDYKDTFDVPEGKRYLGFRADILMNGKYNPLKIKAFEEKEKAGKLLLRRSLLNRNLAGETDCLTEPLTPEAIGQFERERDLIQEGILKAVGPLLDPDGIITQPGVGMAENGKLEENIGGFSLPTEIDTPEARKVFEKALIAGYLEKASTGYYQWNTLPKAAAAYLCKQIYGEHPKWGLLDQLLGCTRLDQAKYQNDNFTNVDKRPWKRKIDALFED